jgi:hypothetical protein
MDNGHLTDEQIQEILDAQAFAHAAFPPWHVKTCRSCAERYRGFQRLYEGLNLDPGFALPADFADSVLDRIPAPRPAFFKSPLFPVALACGAGALTLSVLLILVDMKPLAAGSLRIFNSLLLAFRPLAAPLRELSAWLGGGAKLFLYGGLGLLGASMFDHFLRRQLLHRPR